MFDIESYKPLAFVNIRFDDSQAGTTSDIDGRFQIPNNISKIHLFYVGYRDTIYTINSSDKLMIFNMKQSVFQLNEVEIFPGINPAHRIIAQAINNRKSNKPESLNSFSYLSYNKMVFTAQPDSNFSIIKDSLGVDSLNLKLKEFVDKQHFLLMESVSKRSYLSGRSHERVMATRVSGLKDPLFMLLATQFQSFSFYDPQFNILGVNYINPLSTGSLSNYFFLLRDTIYQKSDTVFIISFRPLKSKEFDGLKGVLYINTDGYAVQNVIVEPAKTNPSLGVKIQQLYQKIDDKAWFPTQLNTDLNFGTLLVNDMPVVGIGTTYLDSILIDPPLSKSLFRGKVSVDIDKNASKTQENQLGKYRKDSLSTRDINTYLFLDSLGKAENLDFKIKLVKVLASGKIPIWKLAIPIDKLFSYNSFEKWRFGIPIETSDILSKHFTLGGYLGIATNDKPLKYGGYFSFTPVPNSDFKLELGYINDLEESGAAYSFDKSFFISTNNYRAILIDQFNRNEEYYGKMQIRTAKYFVIKIGASYAKKQSIDNYLFKITSNSNTAIYASDFDQLCFKTGFRFAWGEKLIRNTDKLISLGTKFPIINFNYTRSVKNNYGSFTYNRFDLQIDKKLNMNYFGKSEIQIIGGFIDSDLPWYLLYNAQASFYDFYIYSFNSFNTMRINEFLSDKYITLYWQHNFGKWIFKKNKYFSPDWVISTNMGWGELNHTSSHKNIEFKTMEKGYFESGFLWTKILNASFTNIGIGAFYRYGPNANAGGFKQNIAYKLTVGYNF